jgi:regulatory protein
MPSTPVNTSEWNPDLAVTYRKAADYCAVQERCFLEVKQKLQRWGAGKDDSEKIIRRMSEEGFINEQRYAVAFARGKFRNLHWGKIKIVIELKRKKINSNLITNAISQIEETEYLETISKLIAKKMRELRTNTMDNRFKAMRFVAGKGFEPELIRKIMKED